MQPPVVRIVWSKSDPAELEGRLSPAERAVWSGWPAEKRRRDWLLGRAAAKQAARTAWREQPTPWSEVEVTSSAHGAPRLIGPPGRPPLAVSLTHGHGQAAAWASPPGPEGGLPGVDLERVRPRRLGTLRFYLHPPERSWVLELPGNAVDPPPPDAAPSPRDLAAIVLWALKEAAFKALQPPRGTGLLDVEVATRPRAAPG
jgi:phosphopantetheinyl transferase (holo-ACP synthase)